MIASPVRHFLCVVFCRSVANDFDRDNRDADGGDTPHGTARDKMRCTGFFPPGTPEDRMREMIGKILAAP
jgi:hypothetical protein